MTRTTAYVIGSFALGACSAQVEPLTDAAPHVDASLVTDSGRPAPVDASQFEDAAAVDGPSDPDAGGACDCTPASECELAMCIADSCMRTNVLDGTGCGAGDDVCVGGACVPRGCGDGYREPGPKPAREACDDGNTEDGDTCSSSCTPTPFVVAARMNDRDAPVGPAASIGIDGAGRALVIWRANMTSGLELRAARFSAVGVPLDRDPPITIASGYEPLHATVAGLRGGGWVVAWSAPNGDGDMAGVLVRTVGVDGRLGTVRVAPEETFLDQIVV